MGTLIAAYSHKGNKLGASIASIAIIAMIITRFSGLTVGKLNAVQQFGLFEWLMLIGLLIMVFSERNYDEAKAAKIRLISFRAAFGISNGMLLTVALCAAFSPRFVITASMLFAIAAIGIIFYLLFFYYAMHLESSSKPLIVEGAAEQVYVKGSKVGPIGYFSLCAILLVIFILLMAL